MATAAPKTPFAVRRQAAKTMGFRAVQVRDYVRSNPTFPTYGEIKRALDFYDRAGAYRVVKRLKDRGEI